MIITHIDKTFDTSCHTHENVTFLKNICSRQGQTHIRNFAAWYDLAAGVTITLAGYIVTIDYHRK